MTPKSEFGSRVKFFFWKFSLEMIEFIIIGPPPLRGSFFLENGTLCDTREKKIFPIGSKNVTPKKRDYALFILVNQTPNLIFLGAKN